MSRGDAWDVLTTLGTFTTVTQDVVGIPLHTDMELMTMMMTRRNFLISTALTSLAPAVLGQAEEPEKNQDLPDGVIAPYSWGGRSIPVVGQGALGTGILDDVVEKAVRAHGIVGCGICVVRGDAIIYDKGFGLAELPDRPFLEGTATRCGSLAKPVTGMAALILADMGKLDLDEPVLPILASIGIVPAPVGASVVDERLSRIKVRHLMDHTSGLPGWATYTAWRPNRNVAVEQKLDHVATAADVARDCLGNASLNADPGERFEYANANFVLLARVIEARSSMSFNEFLTTVAMPRFGVPSGDIYVSPNQRISDDPKRGSNEAAYYQTRQDRFVSFVPSERAHGRVYGEAYRGYATESSDGAGGIACTARGIGTIIANLNSPEPVLSQDAITAIVTPPAHYHRQATFNPDHSSFYSKGFDVRFSGGRPWFAHGGMTIHCGGLIGHNAGYQFVAVSNWNNAGGPNVDGILGQALGPAVAKLT